MFNVFSDVVSGIWSGTNIKIETGGKKNDVFPVQTVIQNTPENVNVNKKKKKKNKNKGKGNTPDPSVIANGGTKMNTKAG